MRHGRTDYQQRIVDTAGLIPENEPVFLLRGKDAAAPETVRAYAEAARRRGAEAVADNALLVAREMETYQLTAGSKPPDMPEGSGAFGGGSQSRGGFHVPSVDSREPAGSGSGGEQRSSTPEGRLMSDVRREEGDDGRHDA